MSTPEPEVGAGLVDLIAEHRPNYVTEGPLGTEFHRTRVKCEGDSCDFYADDPSWFRALERHDAHLARVVQAHVDAAVAAALEGAARVVESRASTVNQWVQNDPVPGQRVVSELRDAARIVREQIPAEGER